MTLQENDKPHLWQLMREIRFDPAFTKDEYEFVFEIENKNITLDSGLTSKIDNRRRLMVELENLETIKILETRLPEFGIYPFNIRILQPKFDEIFKSLEEKYNKIMAVEPTQKEENNVKNLITRMKFDSQNGVIRCGEIRPHSFHRGSRGEKPLLKLFRKLWDERRHVINGVERKKGESFSPEALVAQIEVTKEKLNSMIKSINRMLKTRKFPAKIERKNGILLISIEK